MASHGPSAETAPPDDSAPPSPARTPTTLPSAVGGIFSVTPTGNRSLGTAFFSSQCRVRSISSSIFTPRYCGTHKFTRVALACALVPLYFIALLHERANQALESDPTATLDIPSSWKQPQANAKNNPFSFSACLLIKDDSIILPEWLAYHYTFLPLRRLIVAVDPMSLTDPQPILDSYRSIGMNITIWKNEVAEYWKDGGPPHTKRRFDITGANHRQMLERHRHRQKMFYSACLQKLKDEGRTWTMAVDTDEYIVFNFYNEGEGVPTGCKENTTCITHYKQDMMDGTHHRAKLVESSTAAEHIQKGFDKMFNNTEKPCIVIGRYLFPSRFSQNVRVPSGFNVSYFHTLRYQYRVKISQMDHGKSIIDVSGYDGSEVNNPHRLIGDLCTGSNSFVHNSDMSFRVHHYVGSWESFRRPGFDSRGLEKFQNRNSKQIDAEIDNVLTMQRSLWLSDFALQVGKQRAYELTQQLRIDAEAEMENLINVRS